MPSRSPLADTVVDLLGADRPSRYRAMFGGYGVYRCLADGDRMVGLIADEVLYLKADAHNASAFDAESLEPFVYDPGKPGKAPIEMSYRRAPEEALDDPEVLARWCDLALEAALRVPQKKPARNR